MTEKIIEQLISRLKSGTAVFFYEKENGETREAYGTLNAEIIDMFLDAPKENPKRRQLRDESSSNHYIHYFDIDKKAWRMFLKGRFLGIDNSFHS